MPNIGDHTKGLERRIRQHVIGIEHIFFAVVQPGFEETAVRELRDIGISHIIGTFDGGIEFKGKLADCYTVNICSRTITRLVMRIASFKADGFEKLQKKIAGIPWELHLSEGTAVDFNITARSSRLYHTGRIEEECRDGVISRLMEYGISVRAPEDDGRPVQEILVRLDNNSVQVSLDSSGELLFKRGEKKRVVRAPLRETIASLVLHEAGLRNYDVVLDPMCGSGTFSLEAAGIFMRKFPGLGRTFTYMQWPSFREKGHEYLKRRLSEELDPQMGGKRIIASDNDQRAVDAAEGNIKDAGLDSLITVRRGDFFMDPAPVANGGRCLIVLNPPYGVRLKINADAIYRNIGRVIRKNYRGWGYAIVTPGVEYEKILSLPYDRKVLFMNGGIKVAAIFKDA